MKPEFKYDPEQSGMGLITVGGVAFLFSKERAKALGTRNENHPHFGEITTSAVTSYDQVTGIIETQNTRYVPI